MGASVVVVVVRLHGELRVVSLSQQQIFVVVYDSQRITNNADMCQHTRIVPWHQIVHPRSLATINGGVFGTDDAARLASELRGAPSLLMSAKQLFGNRMGACRRCRAVVYPCRGCHQTTTTTLGYVHGDATSHYASYWCSRSCFERNH